MTPRLFFLRRRHLQFQKGPRADDFHRQVLAYMLTVEGRKFSYPVAPPQDDRFPHGSWGAVLGHADVWARCGDDAPF